MRKLRKYLFVLAAAVALAASILPVAARADGEITVDGGSLQSFIDANPGASVFIVTGGNVAGCNIPSGITVQVSGGMGMDGCTNAGSLQVTGSVTGDFYNTGSISGGNKCTGTIYNTGSVDGGTVRIPGPGFSGVSEVRYSDGSESAQYNGGTLWVLSGRTVAYLVINDFVCTPAGAKLAYSITYLYNNSAKSAMTLDAKKYPATYYVKAVDQDLIPAAPDTEIGYAFSGWYCSALGYTESNLQQTITIPADIGGDLTVISWWTEAPGRNEGKSGASTGMAGGMAGGSGGGITGALSGMVSGLLTTDNSDDDTETTDTLVSFSTGSGGVRVRTASLVQRHAFTDAQTEDIEALANSRRGANRFPWQWIGAGLGGALALLAASVTIRRRLNERNAATLEKLNIHD